MSQRILSIILIIVFAAFSVNPVENDANSNCTVDFYNTRVNLQYHSSLLIKLENEVINTETINWYNDSMLNTDSSPLLDSLQFLKQKLQLNDWGYYLLTEQSAITLYGEYNNESRLLTAFILRQSGYNLKYLYTNDRIGMALSSELMLFRSPYFTSDGMNYFVMDDIYEPAVYSPPEISRTRQINLRLKTTPKLALKPAFRTINFKYEDSAYTVEIAYNKNLVYFYENYPVLDIPFYFHAPVSDYTRQSIIKNLSPLLKNKSAEEKIEFLLQFLHTGFRYVDDAKVYGKEQYRFVEQMLHTPYSDCEERAVLFSWLVRILTSTKVVALFYPYHVSTAVLLPESLEGERVFHNGNNYLICDPSFIGSSIGNVYKSHKKNTPAVYEIE